MHGGASGIAPVFTAPTRAACGAMRPSVSKKPVFIAVFGLRLMQPVSEMQ